MPRSVVFDLDGTLTDPEEGILAALRYAFDRLGRQAPEAAVLRLWIGPPLRASLRGVLNDEEQVERAVGFYRNKLQDGAMLMNRVYPGIAEVLEGLHSSGRRMFVCTAKPAPFARQILDHFGFAHFFEDLEGPDLDWRGNEKTTLLGTLLRRTGLDAATCDLVGDRRDDVVAARTYGLRSFGALWGFGGEAELRAAGADRLVQHPSDLPLALA